MRDHVLAIVSKYLPGTLRPSGGANVLTKCPFHKGGQERKPSFSVNLQEGVFHCFTCHEAGNITMLLKKLGVQRATIDSELSVIRPHLETQQRKLKVEKEHFFVNRDPFHADFILPEEILGVYEWMPTTLVEDGFDPLLLQRLEIGYDRENNRVMYPLRDLYGNLAGFSGGVTPWSKWQSPKYRVYQGGRRGHDGKWVEGDYGSWFDERFPNYRCENHDFLWNYDTVYPRLLGMSDPTATVFVVEGFKACLWMIQCGFQNTVALMGSYISDRQQKMIHRLDCTAVLFLDNDQAGKNGTERIGRLLQRPMHGKVRVVRYPKEDDETQPDDYTPEAIRDFTSQTQTLHEYFKDSRHGQ